MSSIDLSTPHPRDARRTPDQEPEGPVSEALDLADFYSAVRRRLWLLAPSLALTLALACAYLLLTPTRYSAHMSLFVDTRERPPVGVDAQSLPQSADSALVESQMRLIASTEVMRRVVENERLEYDPDYATPHRSLLSRLKSAIFGASPDSEPLVDHIVDDLLKSVTTKRSEKSYVIDVELKAPTRARAVRLARALATAYAEIQNKFIDDVANKESFWINKKVDELQARLVEAERRVETFKREQALQASEGRLLPEQQLKDANAALIEARGKRAEQQSKYQQIEAALRDHGSIEGLGEAVHAPLIEKLRSEFAALSREEASIDAALGPRHPSYQNVKAQLAALRRQIDAELRRIASAAARDLKAARASETLAEKVVADLETSINRLGPPRLELAELERQAAALRERYEKALAAKENVRRDVVSSPNGVLIDQAYADKAPSSPKTLPAILIALAAGLNLFVASALFAEYRSRRVRARGASAIAGAENARSAVAAQSTPGSPALLPAAEPFCAELPAIEGETGAGRLSFEALIAAIMARQDSRYRGAVEEIYEQAEAILATRRSPTLLVAALGEPEDSAALALALAHAACARGEIVLLVDADREETALADAIDAAPPLVSHGSLRRYAFDETRPGKIIGAAMRGDPSRFPRAFVADDLADLSIVHCGRLRDSQSPLAPVGPEAGLLLVERDDADTRDRAALLSAHRLERALLGVIRPERRESWARTGT